MKRKMKEGGIAQAAANLFPGYFALVMATGIISIAAHLLGMSWLAWALLWINAVAYLVLWLLLLIRLTRFFPRVKADITSGFSRPRSRPRSRATTACYFRLSSPLASVG